MGSDSNCPRVTQPSAWNPMCGPVRGKTPRQSAGSRNRGENAGNRPDGPRRGTENHIMITNSSTPSRANWYSCDGCRASCSGIARKDHGPGHIASPAPQLLADEVSQPAEGQAHRHQRRDKVHQGAEHNLVPAGEQIHGEQHAQETAMKRHAALPDPQQPGGILQPGCRRRKRSRSQTCRRAQHPAPHKK